MVDFVFENCFLSAMAPYVYSRDGRNLSIYGSKLLLQRFTTIDQRMGAATGVIHTGRFFVLIPL
jgi:hypothetical protein